MQWLSLVLLCFFFNLSILSGDTDAPELTLSEVSSDEVHDISKDLDDTLTNDNGDHDDIPVDESKKSTVEADDSDDDDDQGDTVPQELPAQPEEDETLPAVPDQELSQDKQEPDLSSVVPAEPAQVETLEDADTVQPELVPEHEVLPLQDMPSPEDEEDGINTVDLQDPAGNWLYKRIWWEKAEARYDKIKAAVNRVLDSRMQFFEQRVNLDRSLFDPFYMSLGLTRGELQEAVSYLIEQLENVSSGDVSDGQQKQFMINTLQAEQKSVEQLQSDVETISKIDHAIDDALTKLMSQINLCRNYEQEGWQYLRSIAQELSDKAARDHYYAMDTLWKNVKNIQQYIDGEFSAHFNELINEAQKQTEGITHSINQLKEKGIDLKKMVQDMLEQDDADRDEELDQDEDADEASVGWLSGFMSILLWPFNKLAELWRYFFG